MIQSQTVFRSLPVMGSLLLLLALCANSAQANSAKNLYETFQSSIFQIRVMELASGNKTSIGSGFLISKQGHIATNYHVISQFIQHPDRYRLEYINQNSSPGELSVADIDVVHDLAIVKAAPIKAPVFKLKELKLAKGMRLYALGNPHDLGMSIVEGTYNGLLDHSLYDKIFFSGSLNPGMSGGPALHSSGVVSGINVSTAGNQLSFLVPVQYLRRLFEQVQHRDGEPTADFFERIEIQLRDNQALYMQKFLDSEWPSTEFGGFKLPGQLADLFKCWGDRSNDKESYLQHSYSQCSSDDRIYLSHAFSTGGISYSYDLYQASELSSMHFYNLYKKNFGQDLRVNSAGKEDVNNYDCHTRFTRLADKDWKSALCVRRYKKYPSLWDVSLEMALVNDSVKGIIIQLALAGVSRDLALKFIDKFSKEIHWQK
ncbi:MAG: serine protease [Gammaproteobacteria bacterium]|nr:serine protease [Gammaproteobacteria bacterium]MDH5802801.1 serine protease [Gammaproteobacteria bacterium]